MNCKNELSAVFTDKSAEFTGFLLSNGKIGYSRKNKSLLFSSREFSIIRKIVKIANSLNLKRNEDIIQKENNRIVLEFREVSGRFDLKSIINQIKNFSMLQEKAFFRGVFLGCGILSTPPSYHIELRFEKEKELNIVEKILNNFSIKHLSRNNIVYITGRENVKAFLYEIGTINAYLYMEQDAVNKKVTNDSNRKVNFEYANLKRQSDASTKQMKIIKKMEQEGIIGNLSEELKDVAELRLEYPYSSLRELSEKSKNRLTKQTIYYRLKKIIKIYEK